MLCVPGQTLRYGNTDINNSNKCFLNNTFPRLGDFIIPSLLRVTRPQEIAFNSTTDPAKRVPKIAGLRSHWLPVLCMCFVFVHERNP